MSDSGALNSYTVLECIHHSRRFSLYHAKHTDSGREVLIKTPDPLQSKNASIMAALMSEAEAAKALSHPSIRAYYASQDEPGAAFFVGEYYSGTSLARLTSPDMEAIPPERVIDWIKDLFAALDYAHRMGIYHLNLNPYNIIIDAENRLKIIGFGKGKNAWLNGEDSFAPWHPVLFVAPETFQAGQAHAASDLYSAAAVAYLAYCHSLPWRIDSLLSTEKQKQQALCRAVIMPEILKKEMPDWLFSTLLSCLKLDPEQRPLSAQEILQIISQETAETDTPATDDHSSSAIALEEDILPAVPPEMDDEPEATAASTPEPSPAEAFTLRIVDEPEPYQIPPELEPEIIPDPEPEPITEPKSEQDLPSEPEPEASPEPENEDLEMDLDDSLVSIFAALEEEDNPEPEAKSDDIETPIGKPAYDEPSADEPPPQQVEIPEQAETMEVLEPAAPPFIAMEPEPDSQPVMPSLAKPAPQKRSTPLYQADPLRKKQAPVASTDLSTLQKTFKTLMWLSLGVLAFIIVKYLILAKRPKFEKMEIPAEIEEVEQAKLEANEPLKMVIVKGDTLVMGNTGHEAQSDEFPLLTLPVRTFYISPREITQQEWMMINPENPSKNKDPKLPVENVSFYEVIEFCNAKSIKDGFQPCYDFYGDEVNCNFEADGYRLPTEAEWEFAAKSGKRYNFGTYSGSNDPDEVGWHSGNSEAQMHQGASKKENQLGLYDLSGNLYEWVWNWYAPYSYRHDPATGPLSGTDKVIRGGSWYHSPAEMRVTNRNHAKPFVKTNYIGFRVVRTSQSE